VKLIAQLRETIQNNSNLINEINQKYNVSVDNIEHCTIFAPSGYVFNINNKLIQIGPTKMLDYNNIEITSINPMQELPQGIWNLIAICNLK